MVESIINDSSYYEKLAADINKETSLKYNKFLNEYQNHLTEKELDYLRNFEIKSSQFYGLPKIHKNESINENCKLSNSSYVEVTDVDDLKLRPIVAGPSCLTHRLSNLLDILLRPFMKHVKSNLRDTTDFLNNLPNKVQPNTLLASFNIEALYSNIPHDLGILAVEYWLEKNIQKNSKIGFQKILF